MRASICIALILPATTALAQQRSAPADSAAQRQSVPVNFDPKVATQLRYRYIGPVGNRVAAVTGVVGDPNVYYAGAASGGIWKTTDAGIHWQPVMDNQQVSAIGALAVARSNADIVWAGTGEPWIRSHITLGNGIYKSTDAGRSWKRMGLDSTGRIARIVVDPTNPDIVFVAAQGHSYGPQQQRGIFRTTDGGATWQRVLFVDENTGGIDVVMSPTDPKTLFAATWQLLIRTWGRESGGPGSGIYVTHDGGTTWRRLIGNGLPIRPFGKVGLAIAPSNPNRVYALIETGDGVPIHGEPTDNGELWRSDDGGNNWQVASYDRNLGCRQPYYTRMAVSSDNPDEAYFLCADFSRTLDGGASNTAARQGQPQGTGDRRQASGTPLGSPGGDNHDMWIDPTNANRMVVANDGGVSISTTRARTWLRQQLPIAQIYHVTVDDRIPYYVYGNKQDGPSYKGPSNSRSFGGFGGGGIARSEWHGVLGGESGFATPDPVDTNIIWSTASGSGSRGGIVIRFDERNRQGQNVEVWPLSTGGFAAADVKYRFIWNAPFLISPWDHRKVYTGSQYVHMSTNGGRSWRVISPDLTRNDKTKQGISGGLTPDNIGVEYGGTLLTIAESRAKRGVLWTGSNDGVVSVTRDSGRTWTNVSPPLPPEAAWGTVEHVEPSRYDAATAYATVDAHQEGNFDAWVYRTHDYGKTWTLITSGIPRSLVGWANVIREDPVRRGLVYLGTENALYLSFDEGDHWQPFNNNLPPAPIYGMVIQERFNDLVIATYGRGFWILDDLSPLQKLTPAVASADAHLFAPRPAYRWRDVPGNYGMTDDPTAGQNPPYGAAINYWVQSVPASPVTIEILDSTRAVVRTFTDTATAGLNRAYWDLRNDTTTTARMRTKPMFDDPFEMDANGTREAPGFGSVRVLMPPGHYTVRLTVGGTPYTQPLEVLKDPGGGATAAEIRDQVRTLLAIQRDHNTASRMVNTIESVRSQMAGLQLPNDAADLKTANEALAAKLVDVEQQLVDLRFTGRGQDEVRWPVRLGGQLSYLASGIASSDFAPTSQQMEVAALLAKETRDVGAALQSLLAGDLAAYNALLQTRGLKPIQVPGFVF
ncbi:MAG TPA: hypothetical protein VJ867_05035 [Gemmatimonadaceae bacterium]|nr:hypothetical protein [Gemmatimonadaceae bacterium]